ncbi:TniB family NTP-binding protein [Rhodococcus sp. IEGM1300]
MSESEHYSHVIPSRRSIVDAEEAVRIRAINEDIWVEYPLAAKILGHVKYMLQLPIKHQSPCLLVHSGGGMGKSALYQRILSLYGFGRNSGATLASMTIRAKHAAGHRIFSDDLIGAVTGNMYRTSRIDDEKLSAAIVSRDIRGIVLDEVNDMLHANRSDLSRNMKLIKELSGAPYYLIVIAIGTHECNEAINSDRQFARRFSRIELTPWRDEQVLRSFIATYTMTFPLKSPSDVDKPAIVKYLVSESDGVLDAIVKMLCNAASWAVLEGREEIDLDLIKKGREMPVARKD